jgi:hypothetical protein
LLRRLDVSSLSLEELQEDQQSPKTPKSPSAPKSPNAPKSQSAPKSQAKASPTRPAKPGQPLAVAPRERGFNPYDGAAIARAAAPKKPPATVKRARAPWWRRLFQRR